MQILDRAKLWKEGMMEQIKREITIMKDLRESAHPIRFLHVTLHSAFACTQSLRLALAVVLWQASAP